MNERTRISTIVLVLLLIMSALMVYLPKAAKADLAESPWPMYGHDPQHTRRSAYIAAQSSNIKWTYDTGDYVYSSPAIGSDGTIYVLSNYLHAINPDGTVRWICQYFDKYVPIEYSSPAVGKDGTIYFGSSDYNFYAVSSNGEVLWNYYDGSWLDSSPTIGRDNTIYVGSWGGRLYAFSEAGICKWVYQCGSSIWSSPAIGIDGTIYVGSSDRKLHAVNPDGTSRWTFPTDDEIRYSSPAIGNDGTIYVGSWDKYLYSITSAGNLNWKFPTEGKIESSPAIGFDGTVYVGSEDGYFYAINPDGNLKWRYFAGIGTYSHGITSSAALGSDGTIYVNSNGHVDVLSSDGILKWSYNTGALTLFSSPAIDSSGTLFTGSTLSQRIYAFAGPANQPPGVPTVPQGPHIVVKGFYWGFTSSATDPDGDDVSITFDWGDGTQDTVGPASPGTVLLGSHSWAHTGMFEVKAKATDIHGAESDWSSPLEVTVYVKKAGNWAGYVVNLENSAAAMLSVEGEWTQPSFKDVQFGSSQYTWIGVGGVETHIRLLQAGIAVFRWWPFDYFMVPFYQAVIGNNKKYYDYDWLHPVSPSDLIRTSITMTGYNQWYILVQDVTKGSSWSKTVNFNPDLTSVEWIHEPGASGSGIAYFNPIAFTEAEYSMNGNSYKLGKIEPALNAELQCWEFTRGGNVLTSVSSLSAYERFTITYLGSGSIPAASATVLSLHSSADLHVYDSGGDHLGYNYTSGLIDVGIPNSAFFEDKNGTQYACLFQEGLYRVELVGKETGDFHLHVLSMSNDSLTLDKWLNGTVISNAIRTCSVSVGVEPLAIMWEYVFKDAKRGTILKISTDDKYFQFMAPNKDFGIKHDPKMTVLKNVIVICYNDSTMRLIATAIHDRIDFCSAVAWDKQTGKMYLLTAKAT